MRVLFRFTLIALLVALWSPQAWAQSAPPVLIYGVTDDGVLKAVLVADDGSIGSGVGSSSGEVTVTGGDGVPICEIGACASVAFARPTIEVDASTGAPVQYGTIWVPDIPYDVGAFDGVGLMLRGKTAAVDQASVDDSLVTATADQYGAMRILPSIGGVDYTLSLEDVAETAGGTLYMAGAVVRAIGTGSTSTAGDNATISVDTGGRLIVTGAALDEAAFTYATSTVLAIGAVAESTTDTLADGAVGAPVMTLSRFLRTTPSGYATGGGVPITMKSDNTNNDDETAVCTGPCTVYSITAFNHAAAAAFFRCENDTTGNTTPGSETAGDGEPNFEIPGATTGAGFTVSFPVGISFSTALTCWIATGEADTDATDAATDDVTVLVSRVQ